MRISILTMCPELFRDFLDSHVVKRADFRVLVKNTSLFSE